MAHGALGGWLPVDSGLDSRAHRGLPQARDHELEVDQVVEPGRPPEANCGLGDDHVGALVHHPQVVADPRPPQLGDQDVEVGEPVGVEDDALEIALAVAHADPVPEGLAHGPHNVVLTAAA